MAGVLAAAAQATALAGQPAGGLDLSGTVPALPPPADTGKPALPPPAAFMPRGPETCVTALPCGTRLYGAIRKDGAVELQVPAWRW